MTVHYGLWAKCIQLWPLNFIIRVLETKCILSEVSTHITRLIAYTLLFSLNSLLYISSLVSNSISFSNGVYFFFLFLPPHQPIFLSELTSLAVSFCFRDSFIVSLLHSKAFLFERFKKIKCKNAYFLFYNRKCRVLCVEVFETSPNCDYLIYHYNYQMKLNVSYL